MVMHDEDESSDDNGDDGDDGDNDDDGGGDNGDNCADNFHLDLDCPQQKDIFLLSHLLQYHRSQYNRTAVLAGFTIETLDETSTNSKNGRCKHGDETNKHGKESAINQKSSSAKRYDFPSSES